MMSPTAQSDRRTVLITGSTRGIGRAARFAWLETATMSSFTAESPLQKPTHFSPNFANSIPRPERYFSMSPIVQLQLPHSADIEAHGIYWGVVLNAGINRDGPLAGMPAQDWDQVLAVDLGAFTTSCSRSRCRWPSAAAALW